MDQDIKKKTMDAFAYFMNKKINKLDDTDGHLDPNAFSKKLENIMSVSARSSLLSKGMGGSLRSTSKTPVLSESSSSDPDDKENPAYWYTGDEFFYLPENI